MADQLSEKPSDPAKEGEDGEPKPEATVAPTVLYPTPSTAPVAPRARGKCGSNTPCIGLCWRNPIFPKLGAQDWRDPNFGRALGAEFTGTMLLVFFGVLSVFVSSDISTIGPFKYRDPGRTEPVDFWAISGEIKPDKLHVSLAFGFAVATIAQALGHVSGAHLNPAVSFGAMIACRTSVVKTVCYIIVQCIGAMVGSLLVYLTTKEFKMPNPDFRPNGNIPKFEDVWINWGMGASTLAPGVEQFPDGMMTEFTLTFLLVFTVLAVTDEERHDLKGSAPLAIGIAVFCAHAAGMYFTGSSVNPARSFGPAIFSDAKNRWKDHWVYWVGPFLGGFEGGFWYMTIFCERQVEKQVAPSQPPTVNPSATPSRPVLTV